MTNQFDSSEALIVTHYQGLTMIHKNQQTTIGAADDNFVLAPQARKKCAPQARDLGRRRRQEKIKKKHEYS